MSIAQGMLAEFEHEAETTRRFLERLPADRLDWKPHEKSLTAGQLALHIAVLPGQIAEMGSHDACPPPDFAGGFPQPADVAEIHAAFKEGIRAAATTLSGFDDDRMKSPWRLVVDGRELMTMPRVAFFRSILLNHLYHHRGQLGVYLRLLGAAVPYAYGPSGDEVPPEFKAILGAMGAAT